MTTDREIRIYWMTVDLCLRSFFGMTPSQARSVVEKTRNAWEKIEAPNRFEALSYHEEPVNLAAALAQSRFAWTPDLISTYQALRERAMCLASKEERVMARLPNKAVQPRQAALLRARG